MLCQIDKNKLCVACPDLEERMADSGVSLYSYGKCEVDGASESYLWEGEENCYKVFVQAAWPNTETSVILENIISDHAAIQKIWFPEYF